VKRPHECQRFRVTRRAPHFGQIHIERVDRDITTSICLRELTD
jgi:hypothetical protein